MLHLQVLQGRFYVNVERAYKKGFDSGQVNYHHMLRGTKRSAKSPFRKCVNKYTRVLVQASLKHLSCGVLLPQFRMENTKVGKVECRRSYSLT